jgi:hypothetical protein
MNDRDVLVWELRRADRHLYLDKPREQAASAWSAVDRIMLRALGVLAAATVLGEIIRGIL